MEVWKQLGLKAERHVRVQVCIRLGKAGPASVCAFQGMGAVCALTVRKCMAPTSHTFDWLAHSCGLSLPCRV